MNPLKDYLDQLSPDGRAAFASRAGSSVESIRITAGAYRTGGLVDIHPEFAARLEHASHGTLGRTALSSVCSTCPHAQLAKAIAQE